MAQYVVTDTELEAVADAIRLKGHTSADLEWTSGYIDAIRAISGGGGGSVNILSGEGVPTAELGDNGAIYLQYGVAVNYIKLSIFAVRSSGNGMQLSLVNLLDDNDAVVAWPSGTTVTSNKPAYVSNEGPNNLLSNVNTKYYTSTNPSAGSPIEIVFALGSPVSFSKWKWYTANDMESRDPKSFALSVSANGTDYIVLDSKTITPTTTRKAVAYTSSTLSVPQIDIINSAYAKVGGAWQPLIGTDINDINLGGDVVRGFEVAFANGDGFTQEGVLTFDNQYFVCYFDDNMSTTYTLNGVSRSYSILTSGNYATRADTLEVTNTPTQGLNAVLGGSGSRYRISHDDDGSYCSILGGWTGYPTGGTIYKKVVSGTQNTITLGRAHSTLLVFIGACGSSLSSYNTVSINGISYTVKNIGNHYGMVSMYGAIELNGNTSTTVTVTLPVSCYSFVSIVGLD